MWKLLLFLAAILANTHFVASGLSSSSSQSSSNSSSSSSSQSSSFSQSSSSSDSSSGIQDSHGCSHDGGDNDNGNSKKCGANQTFVDCPDYLCRPMSCAEVGFPVACPIQAENGSCPGKSGCVCVDGYVKYKGVCIPSSKCPNCGGDKNARVGCGENCNKHCSDIGQEPKACKKICRVNSCDCKDGYYLSDDGKCVKPDQCNKPPSCGINEVVSNCTNGECEARNCSQLGNPVPCVKLDPASCKKGCVCANGYLRDDSGTCILKSKCPSCGGDPNAKSGCGIHCGNTCATYKNKPAACPSLCMVNGCDCKPNYVYDPNIKKCVFPEHCTPTCKINEVYSSCVNGNCEARNCSQYGKPVPCVRPRECIKGCICQKDYLRAENGTCIPQNQCCNSQSTTTTNTTDESTGYCKEDDPQDCLTTGNVDFTLDFLHQMIKINSGKSIVMSPFSVLFPLAQLALYTDPGESYNQLMFTLNLNTKDQIRKVFTALIRSVQSQQEVILNLAAKTYVNDNAVLTKNFENDSVEVFRAKAESLDFSDTQKAADTINDWVEEVTKGLIQSLVSPSMFSEYTRIVLVNAIYFLGNWQTQFNPNNTNTEDFYKTKDDTVPVPMMFRKGSYKFSESSSLDCKILEIPYKGGNFSYVLFLPNEIDGYAAVAEKIKDTDVLNEALDSLSYKTCLLSLPRHNITSSIDLNSILQKLNITDIFNDSTSDLSGILDNLEKLSVTSAVQKANIRVNEIGTEAAAANAIVVGTTSVILDQIVVKADHPFLFLLLLKRNPLFCGVYAGN